MAEPTDRPSQALTGAAESPPGPAPAPHPARPVAPAPEGRADAAPDYRPLALAAIGGFSLAALYAAFLVVCWLAAWFSGTPLLMSPLTLLLPLAALVVSALGWLQVQRSEGTRAGAKLALWGMALSALFGLSYTAYLLASFAALRQQAEAFAGEWVNLVREHKYDEAFRLTLDPAERPAPGPQLQRELELRFNSGPEGGSPGRLTVFTQSSLVRAINHGPSAAEGADTQVKPLGVQNWEYKNGGYQLRLVYDVHTPAYAAELVLTLHSTDRKGEGRDWGVIVAESGVTPQPSPTPPQVRLAELKDSSSAFVEEWIRKLGSGRGGEAYLETQDPDRRAVLRARYGAGQLAGALDAGPTPARGPLLLDPEAARELYLPGYRDFRRGGLVQAPPDTFWADERVRKDIPEATRRLFERPAELLAPRAHLTPVAAPLWAEKDGRLRFYHDASVVVAPRYMVQGWFVTETDARALDEAGPNPTWRLAALELSTGRTLSSADLMRLLQTPGAVGPR
jgi:hypothetical protein